MVLTDVERKILGEFPSFKVVYKHESLLMKAIDLFLKVITFWQMSTFLTQFTTTVGTTVYVSRNWTKRSPYSKAVTLRHETVHMRQRARMGTVLFSLSYLFWVFPVGLAKGRRDLEREGYEETLRAYYEYYGYSYLFRPDVRKRIVSHFTGPSYFWMWPFRKDCERWYDRVVSKIVEAEESGG